MLKYSKRGGVSLWKILFVISATQTVADREEEEEEEEREIKISVF
jgi:hypothetical protein